MGPNELIIKIGATSKEFEYELKKIQRQTEALEDQLATAARVSAAAFVALSAAVAGATSRAAKFEETFSNVVTQLDKGSFKAKSLEAGIADLRQGVIALGVRSGQSFDVLNQGLFELISAGVPAEEAISQLSAATDLAIAGATDTASAVKALVAAYTSFGSAAGNAQEVAEKFFVASKFGVTDVQAVATEFNKVAGLAKTLGVSFNEALGSATALTNNGAKPTAQAFTQFEAVLVSVIDAQKRLREFSPEVQKALSLENVQRVGINEALRQTIVAVDGNVASLQKLLGSSNALQGALSLTGAQAGTVKLILGTLNDEQSRAAQFADALKVKQETLNSATARLKTSLDAAAIVIGEQFVPLIKATADFVGGLASKFSELPAPLITAIGYALRFGLALTGLVAAGSAAILGFVQVSNAVRALGIVLGVGRISALKFWGAVTLGASVILTFLPEIIDKFKSLIGLLNGNSFKPKGLTETGNELERLKKLRDDIANDRAAVNFGSGKDAQLQKIDEKIAALEKQKQKQLEVNAAAAGKASPGETTTTTPDDKKGKKKDEETLARIAAAEAENKKLVDLAKQRTGEISAEEAAFNERRRAIEAERLAAAKILDDEERAQALENIRIKNENLLAEEQDYQIKRAEVVAQAREQQAVIDEELALLDQEQKAALRQADLEQLAAQVQSEADIRNENAKRLLQDRVNARNQYLKDELRFGTQIATIQQFLNTEQVQGAKNAANQLIALQQSKNETLKSIGKAAALTQIAINTAEGAVGAYKSLAPIPFVGPALGAAAAAALVAFGAEQTGKVLAANTGGLVTGGIPGRDSVPALLTPGELVVPAQNFDEVVGATQAARGEGEGAGAGGTSIVIQGDFYGEETFIDRLAERLTEAQRTRNVRLA